MTKVATELYVDWTECELIERVPGKVSGRSIVRGTRVMPGSIVNSHDLGDSVEEIHEGFPSLSIVQIRQLLEFAETQRKQPVL